METNSIEVLDEPMRQRIADLIVKMNVMLQEVTARVDQASSHNDLKERAKTQKLEALQEEILNVISLLSFISEMSISPEEFESGEADLPSLHAFIEEIIEKVGVITEKYESKS